MKYPALSLLSLALAGVALAQTVQVPITGSATLPDGTKVPFTGTGTLTLPLPPSTGPTLSSPALDWGPVVLTPTRVEQRRLLVLTNEGSAPITVTPQAVPLGEFSLKTSAGAALTLKPQEQVTLLYGFNPTALGTRSATATLSTAAGSIMIPLSGSLIPLPPTQGKPGAVIARRPGAGVVGAVGPDAPLSASESAAFTRRITVSGFTPAAITAAISQAVTAGIPVVYLPPGTYVMTAPVTVPGGLTILGAGSGTVLKSPTLSTQIFNAGGDRVRFTRLKLSGFSTAWTDAAGNDSRGIQNLGKQEMRVDHCELSGFSIAMFYQQQATGRVDHCKIHHNPVIGQGYGVMVRSGSYVLVSDNELGDNRVCLVSGDVSGYRATHWEFVRNHVKNEAPSSWQHGACDTHSYFLGTFLAEGNAFDGEVSCGVECAAGSGLIRGNQFTNMPRAVWMYQYSENGMVGLPHDITISGNAFVNIPTPLVIRDQAAYIVMDGRLVRGAAPGAKKP